MKAKLVYLLFVIAVIVACKKDKKSEKLTPSCDGSSPTYQSTIKNIIDSKCASASCHPGYSTYEGLQQDLQNGSFSKEVLTDQTMPKDSKLSQDQLNKIQCWVNNGFPEN
jgi:hypothetical protein